MKNILRHTLTGLGQIMLQGNTVTGLLFLLGLTLGGWQYGIAGGVAAFIGTLSAVLFRYQQSEIKNGLYGFNAALVGIALVFFFEFSWLLGVIISFGAVLSTLITRFFIGKKFPAYTFPFILVVWAVMLIQSLFPGIEFVSNSSIGNRSNAYELIFNGFAQVFFQIGIWPGLLFLAGVFYNNTRAGIFGVLSVLFSMGLGFVMGAVAQDVYAGLLSYNAVLCVMVFVGKDIKAISLSVISVILSVFILLTMRYFSLPALTFPFVLAVWLTLVFEKIWFKKETDT